MVNQRSKSGCWTCRLRRKKCPEDGMPCSNCKARGVVCHGYGPRPAWKDRGEREQQEVDRLQLRRRSQTRCHSQATQRPELTQGLEQASFQAQQSAGVCPSPALVFASPAGLALQPSPPQSNAEQGREPYDFSALLDLQPSLAALNTPSVLSEFWSDGMEGFLHPAIHARLETSAATLTGQTESPQTDVGRENSSHAALRTFGFSSFHFNTLSERETELMMRFLDKDFDRLYPCCWSSPMADKAWLMWLLHRSPTFFYSALSTSAYFEFLDTPSHDGKRTDHFREYDGFKNKATELYCEILETNYRGGGPLPMDWAAREIVICSVQLAMLESLSEPCDAPLVHLNSAPDALVKVCEDRGYIGELSPNKSAGPSASSLENRAVDFFTCMLIWVHVVHSSLCQSRPAAAQLYRQLLSSATLGETFLQVLGCEAWAIVALMDAIDAEIWRRDQDANNRLSMRELVSKSEAILSAIGQKIQGTNDAQTLIYGHSIAIYIHTLTSGCRPAVPEIQDTLDKCVPLWSQVSVRRGKLRSMAWAFCVSASLATGEHRSALAKVLSEAAAADPGSTTVACLKALSEECWRILDAGGAVCDWRMVMQSLKRNTHSIFT